MQLSVCDNQHLFAHHLRHVHMTEVHARGACIQIEVLQVFSLHGCVLDGSTCTPKTRVYN
jgi:hypothetical protein